MLRCLRMCSQHRKGRFSNVLHGRGRIGRVALSTTDQHHRECVPAIPPRAEGADDKPTEPGHPGRRPPSSGTPGHAAPLPLELPTIPPTLLYCNTHTTILYHPHYYTLPPTLLYYTTILYHPHGAAGVQCAAPSRFFVHLRPAVCASSRADTTSDDCFRGMTSVKDNGRSGNLCA